MHEVEYNSGQSNQLRKPRKPQKACSSRLNDHLDRFAAVLPPCIGNLHTYAVHLQPPAHSALSYHFTQIFANIRAYA
jgi:hypothetical protein